VFFLSILGGPKTTPGQSGTPGSGSAQVPVFFGGRPPRSAPSDFFTACQAGSVPVVEHSVVVEVFAVVEAARRRPHTV